MTNQATLDHWHMELALQLAARGQGHVEPNPPVGCVIARGAEVVGLGWHRRYGGPHAEVEALRTAGPLAQGATLYVTLEPCCHRGKTPPCTEAILHSGVRRVVAAMQDPFPQVQGKGLEQLRRAGLEVEQGLLEGEARKLLAPYLKRVETGRPWVIAKWASTWDGKLATHQGHSRWISNEASRRVVHQLRGRMDAIVVGSGTVLADDPQLTARPPGPRTATRIVLDFRGRTPEQACVVRTAREVPTLIVTGKQVSGQRRRAWEQAGCEVLVQEEPDPLERWDQLLQELGRRRMTNVLVEGGARVLGQLLAAGQVDEVHLFLATKLLGGQAPSPQSLDLPGADTIQQALHLEPPQVQVLGGDVYLQARVHRE